MSFATRPPRHRGGTIIEFAIVIPVLLMVIFTGIELLRYLIVKQTLRAGAVEALSVAATIQGIEDDDETVRAAAVAKVVEAAKRFPLASFVHDTGSGGSALTQDPQFILPTVSSGSTLRDELIRSPMTIRMSATFHPLTPFISTQTITLDAAGYREVRNKKSIPVPRDCHNNLYTSPAYDPQSCYCNTSDPNSHWDSNTGSCICNGQLVRVNNQGSCVCPPPQVATGDGTTCACSGSNICDPGQHYNNVTCSCECDAPKVMGQSGTCVCPGQATDNGSGGCTCPITCSGHEYASPDCTHCVCPTMLRFGDPGTCGCITGASPVDPPAGPSEASYCLCDQSESTCPKLGMVRHGNWGWGCGCTCQWGETEGPTRCCPGGYYEPASGPWAGQCVPISCNVAKCDWDGNHCTNCRE